jgi:hypothetical protein
VQRGFVSSGVRSGFQWNVTFGSFNGDAAQLYLNATKLTGLSVSTSASTMVSGVASDIQAVTVQGAQDGTFALSFNGEATAPIPVWASASTVASALEALQGVGSVMVTRSAAAGYGAGVTWTVTFLGNGGDLPYLTVDASRVLPQWQGSVGPAVTVTKLQPGTARPLGGNFTLSFDTDGDGIREVASISSSASASRVQSILRAMGGKLSSAVVSRAAYGFNGGYAWDVTFASGAGNNPLIVVGTGGLTGSAPTALVYKRRVGSQSEVQAVRTSVTSGSAGGSFFLAFREELTTSISASATANQLETALNGLKSIGTVTATRASLGNNLYQWLVTFVSPLIDGEQPLLVAGGVDPEGRYSTLTGTGASVNVTRVLSGSRMAVQGSMSIGFRGRNASVPSDVQAADLAAQLQGLGAGAVNVSRRAVGPSSYQTFQWNITFAELAGVAPVLTLNTSGLSSGGAITGAVVVTKAGSAPCCLSGTVAFVRNNVTTRQLSISADAATVQAAMVHAWGLTNMTVSRVSDPNGGAEWRVSFPPSTMPSGATYAFNKTATALKLGGVANPSRTSASVFAAQPQVVPHIQTVVIQASTPLAGSFRLGLNGSMSGPIAIAAEPWEVQAALEQGGLFAQVDVRRNSTEWDLNDVAWDITFPSVAGSMALLTCDVGMLRPQASRDARCRVYRKQASNSRKLAGSFALALNGETTSLLPYDATAAQVRDALQALASVGAVSVARSGPNWGKGFRWDVTFQSAPGVSVRHVGAVPLMSVAPAYLSGTQARAVVVETVRGSFLEGNFSLAFGGQTTAPLPYNASEEAVELALEGLSGLKGVTVRREALVGRLGYAWNVEFSSVVGDLELLQGNSSGLLGTDARVVTYERTPGADPITGVFTVGFGGAVTRALPCDASASDVEAALEELPTVGDVVVQRTPHAADEGFDWDVTFTTFGRPQNIGNLTLMGANATMLRGSYVALEVAKLSAGCCDVELAFNGQDFTTDAVAFKFDRSPMVTGVAPALGPSSGGTAINVTGVGFAFGADDPERGMVFCEFGDLEVPGRWLSDSLVSCVTPAHPAAAVAVTLRALALNRTTSLSSTTVAMYRFHPEVVLQELRPPMATFDALTTITVAGSGFVGDDSTACVVEAWLPTNATANGTIYSGPIMLPATVANASVLTCEVPDYLTLFTGLAPYLDDKTLGGATMLAYLRVTNNGQDSSAPLPFRFAHTPSTASIWPSKGSQVGGTEVTVRGSGFLADAAVMCQFGHAAPVPARVATPTALTCRAPPHADVPSAQRMVVAGPGIVREVQRLELILPSTSWPSIGGTFTLRLEDEVTRPMGWNASAAVVGRELERLQGAGNVTVTRDEAEEFDPRRDLRTRTVGWTVAFDTREGDVPQLLADTYGLTGTTVGDSILSRTLVNGGHGDARAEVGVVRITRAPLQPEVQRVRLSQGPLAQEVQRIRLTAASTISGSFVVAAGPSSQVVNFNVTEADMRATVEVG